jgi:phosphatidylserine/phosphatidylglycerophosphate/cardiolipin synthase-like enzyme
MTIDDPMCVVLMEKALRVASQLDPVFCIDSSKLIILKNPKEFYDTIVDGIFRSKKRILMTTLYLGNGNKEVLMVHLFL